MSAGSSRQNPSRSMEASAVGSSDLDCDVLELRSPSPSASPGRITRRGAVTVHAVAYGADMSGPSRRSPFRQASHSSHQTELRVPSDGNHPAEVRGGSREPFSAGLQSLPSLEAVSSDSSTTIVGGPEQMGLIHEIRSTSSSPEIFSTGLESLRSRIIDQAPEDISRSFNSASAVDSESIGADGSSDLCAMDERKTCDEPGDPSARSEAALQRMVRELIADKSLSEAEKSARRQALYSAAFLERSQAIAKARLDKLQANAREPSFSSMLNPDTGEPYLGCKHYPRDCKILAKCCGLWFVCRLCHDEAQSHVIDRHQTEFVMCMICWKEQPVAAACVACGNAFAKYFCKVCKFYDNSPSKSIYHCPQCGICRVGKGLGIDNFHCEKCKACVSIDSKSTHHCLSSSLDADCPICSSYLFTSTEPVIFMRCGHTMHAQCFATYAKKNFVCPLCCKSFTDMTRYYEQIDLILERERMPSDYDNHYADIYCYDCNHRSRTKYHFVYHKCQRDIGGCGGYNTRLLSSCVVVPSEAEAGNDSQPPIESPFYESRRVSTSGPHAAVLPAERDHMSIEIDPEYEDLPAGSRNPTQPGGGADDAADENGDSTGQSGTI